MCLITSTNNCCEFKNNWLEWSEKAARGPNGPASVYKDRLNWGNPYIIWLNYVICVVFTALQKRTGSLPTKLPFIRVTWEIILTANDKSDSHLVGGCLSNHVASLNTETSLTYSGKSKSYFYKEEYTAHQFSRVSKIVLRQSKKLWQCYILEGHTKWFRICRTVVLVLTVVSVHVCFSSTQPKKENNNRAGKEEVYVGDVSFSKLLSGCLPIMSMHVSLVMWVLDTLCVNTVKATVPKPWASSGDLNRESSSFFFNKDWNKVYHLFHLFYLFYHIRRSYWFLSLWLSALDLFKETFIHSCLMYWGIQRTSTKHLSL